MIAIGHFAFTFKMDAEPAIGFAVDLDGGIEDTAAHGVGVAIEFEIELCGSGGVGDREAREQREVAYRVAAAGVIRMGQGDAAGEQCGLQFCQILAAADFAHSEYIGCLPDEQLDQSLLFRCGLRNAGGLRVIDAALHG